MARVNRLLLVLVLTTLGHAFAEDFTFEVHTGNSAHAPNTLIVHQAGHDPVSITGATYTTRPFLPVDSLIGLTEDYYSLRVGYFAQDASQGEWDFGVELEFLHDKAYYEGGDDPDKVVRYFELSDGLNQLMLNVVARFPLLADETVPGGRLHLVGRAGIGPAITAPASVVRGLQSGTRTHMAPEVFYVMAGPSAQASAQVRYYVTPSFALSIEGKATIAHTRNTIAEGYASATFHGLHWNVGVTFQVP